MSKETFTTMANARTEGQIPEVGVGMLGYAFMGKAHSNAYKKIPYMMYPPPAIPKLVAICGREEAKVAEAARRYGYQSYYTDWQKMLKDADIQLFDNGGPNNLHAEPSHRRRQAGKHVLCEKAARPHRGMRPACWRRSRRPASSTWWPLITVLCPPFARSAT